MIVQKLYIILGQIILNISKDSLIKNRIDSDVTT